MICRHMRAGRDRNGVPVMYPCGQCTPCQVAYKSKWTLRHLLESRASLCAHFVTLTFEDSALSEANQPEKLMRRFIDALRKQHLREGLSIPIRYFGVYELGGISGRPHFHLLAYNALTLPSEKGRFHIGAWPHGHLDCAEFNAATVNYVLGYSMKARMSEDFRVFRTIRPAIGFYGLRRLAAYHAKQHSTLPSVPEFLEIGARRYPLDKWSRKVFRDAFRQAGGSFATILNPSEKYVQSLLRVQATSEFDWMRSARREKAVETLKAIKDQREGESLWGAYQVARAKAGDRSKARTSGGGVLPPGEDAAPTGPAAR